MPRPSTKQDLLTAATQRYDALLTLIESIAAEGQEQEFEFDDRDRNIRDVLIHLYEWHLMLLTWVNANHDGISQPFLPPPYNWRTYGGLNLEFQQKHQATPYAEAREMLAASHSRVCALIAQFSDHELFTKGAFGWTGGTTLGSYFISCTSSHYDWAIKKIKRHAKALAQRA